MALLHESSEFKKLDVRMIERNIARGHLERSELDAAVQNLPDDSENAEWVNLETLTQSPDELDSSNKAH